MIGLSLVRLLARIENLHMLDGTPLLDIKPYAGEFDRFRAERLGRLERAF